MKTTNAIVLDALAHQLDREPSTIQAWQHLELDLYMSGNDLLRVVREVAEVEDVELPVHDLTAMATVGDLLTFVSRTVARRKTAHSLGRVA
jgi:acyl carrier protein